MKEVRQPNSHWMRISCFSAMGFLGPERKVCSIS